VELAVQSEKAVTALGALANEHRLALFRLLVRVGTEGLPAGAIAAELGIPNSSLSFHLAHLNQAGLVTQERRGRSLIYSADYAAMNALVGYLMENCCAGADGCGSSEACDNQPSNQEREML
jgi:ArsR family transcriptional regulator, arsenate/arsenite/antimonite-responsive transcriptional repressor